MPYISITTAEKLTDEQKIATKSELGKLITILPEKVEGGLMVDFSDGHTMFFRGNAAPVCAFVEIRIFRKSPLEAKKEFTAEVFKLMERQFGIKNDQMFLNIVEFENWGSAGVFKS